MMVDPHEANFLKLIVQNQECLGVESKMERRENHGKNC